METRSDIEPFFDESNQSELAVIARSWKGTPFHPHGRIKFVGVDCVHLVAGIYRESGFLPEFNPPHYTVDGGDHMHDSIVLRYVRGTERFAEFGPEETPQSGDLLVFRFGRVAHHVGIMVTVRTFVHVIRYQDVLEVPLADPTWRRRLEHIFRPIAA